LLYTIFPQAFTRRRISSLTRSKETMQFVPDGSASDILTPIPPSDTSVMVQEYSEVGATNNRADP
jgi:hypothetical protein